MALTGHKDLILDLGDGISFKLVWDDKEKDYRGYALPEMINMGTFELEILLQIVNGEVEEASLEIAGGLKND